MPTENQTFAAPKHVGTVRKWKAGYGFICVAGQPDVFVHYTDLLDGLHHLGVGDHVEFQIGPGKQGVQARNVRVLT